MARVLVVAAHPDDEVLGCGGTIALHADAGDQVQVLIVAEGATSRQQQRDRVQATDELSALAQAAQRAGAILGAQGVELLGLPDNRLDSLVRLDLIKQIDERIAHHQPQVVYAHHAGDVNVDHRRLHPPFQPNWFVDISNQWPRKREALAAHASEMRPWPHARSLEALEPLARWRGAQVGVEAAEAFCLLRQLS